MIVEELDKEDQTQKKQQEEKIKDVANAWTIKIRKNKILNIKVLKKFSSNDSCDYTTTARHGLKIHNKKVYSLEDYKEFQAACDICEKILENEFYLKTIRRRKNNTHISI